jgi:branched-chain amino acid transport system substrate-binding protein
VPAGFAFGFLRPTLGLLRDLSSAQEVALGLAVDDVNAAGGVAGSPVAMVTVDEPEDGDLVPAIEELAETAGVVLGPVSSDSAAASLDPLAETGMIACSASATAPDLSTLDTEGVLFRTAISDAVTVAFVAEQLAARQAAAALPEGETFDVVIVARTDDYGLQVGNGLAATLLAQGIGADVIGYNPRRVVFSEEAAEVASRDADAVVLVSYAESVRLIESLIAAGVPADRLVGLDGSFDPRLASRSVPSDPTAVDGMQVIGTTGGRAFLDRLVADPATEQVIYGAQMYDCAIAVALAVHSSGSTDPAVYAEVLPDVTAEGRACSTYADCIASIDAGDDIDYEGVSGGLRFDEFGDVQQARFTVAEVREGELTEVSSTDVDLDELRQQEAFTQAIFTTRVQQLLTALGYYTGPIDGQSSEELTAAIGALQADLGVPVTGVWDAETDAAVRERYGELTTTLGDAVTGLQELLAELGYYTGPIDGTYSQATVEAVRALQRDLGVPETGVLDAATLRAIYEQGVIAGTPPTTTPPETTPPETTPPTTEPPPTAPPTTAVPPPDPEDATLLEVLTEDGRFTTLLGLVADSGFEPDVGVLGPLTVFAPTDDAFAALDPSLLAQLGEDPAMLATVLSYHLVEDWLTIDELAGLTSVLTVHGETIEVTVDGDTVRVNGAATIPPELPARNGIVIPIDAVLIPPELR